jgi:hypothetical protein
VPVLLLAQGDPQAKDMLRQAIEARYALSPPAIDHLKLELTGRARAKVGPVMMWVPLQIKACFRFPSAIRWDFIVRPVGVPVQRGTEAYDGETYRQLRGPRKAVIVDNPQLINSLQSRVWSMAAVLLTPLGEHFVRLEATGPASFVAVNTRFNDTVQLHLRADSSLKTVEVTCLNPDTDREQQFRLELSENQTPINDIMLPDKISAFWDDQPYYEVRPRAIENMPSVPDEVFTLTGESS